MKKKSNYFPVTKNGCGGVNDDLKLDLKPSLDVVTSLQNTNLGLLTEHHHHLHHQSNNNCLNNSLTSLGVNVSLCNSSVLSLNSPQDGANNNSGQGTGNNHGGSGSGGQC